MSAPPLLAGAVKLTVAWALPPTAVTFRGAPGTVKGVTADDALEVAPVPALFSALTVKV